MRATVDGEAFYAVAEQNIEQAVRSGTMLCLCCLTATSSDSQRAVDFTETIVELFLTSLRASDSVGRIAEAELGIVLLGARRLDAFDVLRELGRVAERENVLDPDVRVHLGIAEIDPAYGGAPVLDLLDVARRDLQMPPVDWSEPRGGALID
jgi:hypothetical protein